MAPKKKQKTGEDSAAATEGQWEVHEDDVHKEVQPELKAELAQNETEKDAANDKRKKLTETVRFLTADTTANVVPATFGNMLLAVKDGGLNNLCAGARSSVGVKSGRYAFEVKVVESMGAADGVQKAGAPPKSLLRVGFATKGSGLILGEGIDNVSFDESGALVYNTGVAVPSGTPKKNALMFSNNASVVLLLNLDEKSPNFNTISLFHDGKRVSKPEPLPEALKGEVLYPTVSFRSVTVHANFAEQPQSALPFKCRMLGDSAAADVVVTEDKAQQLEVIFPVCLPDKGTFEWVDWFLEKNEGRYSELSDRAILDWGLKSGLKNTHAATKKGTADKPDANFNVKGLDDGTAKDLLVSLSPMQNRSYVVMEVRGNLLKEERAAALKKWRYGPYKKVAQVMMGKPEEAFMKRVHELLLAEKQAKLDEAFEAEQLAKAKKKAAIRSQKQVQLAMKKAAKIRKKMQEDKERKAKEAAEKEEAEAAAAEAEATAAQEAAEAEVAARRLAGEDGDKAEEAKEADGAEDGEAADETKKEEVKEEETKADEPKADAVKAEEAKPEEEKAEEEEEEDEEMEEEEEEAGDEKPPVATLTPVELQAWFRKLPQRDLSEEVTTKMFGKASLPREDEGFDEVRCTWASSDECEQHLRRWVVENKLTSKIEGLQPSKWFKEKWENWQKNLQAWHVKHMEFKDPANKKDQYGRSPFAKAPPMQPPYEQKEEKEEKEEADVEMDDDKDPIVALEEELDKEEIDIFGLENICEMDKEGTPLFSNFAFEDWALLSLRFELHLLVHSFRHDANDPERTGVHPEHLAFYYNRYYKKALNPKNYGVESVDELVELVKDTALADSTSKVIESMVTDDLESNDIFVKLTEESRRDRARRVDAGDESAKLKFSRPAAGVGIAATAPPAGGIPGTSKAGGIPNMRPPVGGLGQKVKAPGPQFAPKQPAWGAGGQGGVQQPQQGNGMRPWGAMGGMQQQRSSMMSNLTGQWGNFFGGGNQQKWW